MYIQSFDLHLCPKQRTGFRLSSRLLLLFTKNKATPTCSFTGCDSDLALTQTRARYLKKMMHVSFGSTNERGHATFLLHVVKRKVPAYINPRDIPFVNCEKAISVHSVSRVSDLLFHAVSQEYQIYCSSSVKNESCGSGLLDHGDCVTLCIAEDV